MSSARIIAGQYEIGDYLGEGAWGVVRTGRDIHTGETVAVKILKTEVLQGIPYAVERFKREADALNRLNHPNIVKVLTSIIEKNLQAIVMEYAGGGSLGDMMKHPPLPLPRVVQITLELMSALISLQQVGIIHRDLKPGNILFASDGTLRLTDFGLVYIIGMEHITLTGIPMGTTGYLSPEAVKGETLDGRADLWASGVMLYEMLTGQLPFNGRNYVHTLNAIIEHPVPDIIPLRPDCPADLVTLVNHMLTKNREARIQAADVKITLENILKTF